MTVYEHTHDDARRAALLSIVRTVAQVVSAIALAAIAIDIT